MTRTIEFTRTFKKDFKREQKIATGKRLDLDKTLKVVVDLLAEDKPLPRNCFDHLMIGNWNDHRNCHIRPDLVLLYRKVGDDVLQLVRLGSHSELGI
jgi:mRNA interferase YafQ